MTFSEPYYLWLLLPLFGWTVWYGLQMRGNDPIRKYLAVGLRAFLFLLLTFALAGAQTVHKNKGIATVFVLDRSASMDSTETKNSEAFISKALEAQGPDDISGLILFGKDPVIDTETGALKSLARIYASPDPTATDIAAAIRLATATIPEGYGKRVVLLTDGDETSGSAADASEAARADGVEIDAAPIYESCSRNSEVMIESVNGPNHVTRGEPFELRTVIRSTGYASGILHIDRDGAPTKSMPVTLSPGENVIAISQSCETPGFFRYRATLDVDNDTDPRNNVGMTYVEVVGRPRVLLVEGTPGSAAVLQAALAPHDIDVDRVGPGGVPTSPEEIQSYDAVILSDFPAEGMTLPQMSMMTTAVQNSGIGFGMIGGDSSFLPGGYYETPIADALPVDLNVLQRRSFPSTCIEIVVDASGSMSLPEDGIEKVKIAGTAAAAMVRMMSPNDLVGVAGSTDDIKFVAPIQPATNKEAIAAECGTLEAGDGGIYIEPSLEFADSTLSPVKTQVRHLILMSDGDDAEAQPGSFDLARKMVAKGMTISVIAVGTGKDVGFLQALAALGKGYYYLADQANKLPRIVTQDSSLISHSAIEVGAFIPKSDPSDEVLKGIDVSTIPPLYAYDLTSDRPLARTPMRTDKDDPLLAYWQYGLGTTMAFTSDAQPKWARHWMNWSGFSSFWAQAIRATIKDRSSDNIQVDTHLASGKGIMDISAFDSGGAAIDGLKAKFSVIAPDGTSHPVSVEQTGPGRYGGSFDADQTGGYVITAAQRSSGTTKPLITRAGFSVAYPPEYQAIGPNTDLLDEITHVTGGKIDNSPIDCFRPSKNPGVAIKDLWPSLLLASVLLFVLDIAVRRLAFPYTELAERVSDFVGRALMRRQPLRLVRKHSTTLSATRSAQTSAVRSNVQTKDVAASTSATAPDENNRHQVDDEQSPTPKPTRSASPALSTAQRLLEAKKKKNNR